LNSFRNPFSHLAASAIDVEQLESRSDIDVCKAVLIAHKAAAFCSSFVPIHDNASYHEGSDSNPRLWQLLRSSNPVATTFAERRNFYCRSAAFVGSQCLDDSEVAMNASVCFGLACSHLLQKHRRCRNTGLTGTPFSAGGKAVQLLSSGMHTDASRATRRDRSWASSRKTIKKVGEYSQIRL